MSFFSSPKKVTKSISITSIALTYWCAFSVQCFFYNGVVFMQTLHELMLLRWFCPLITVPWGTLWCMFSLVSQ